MRDGVPVYPAPTKRSLTLYKAVLAKHGINSYYKR